MKKFLRGLVFLFIIAGLSANLYASETLGTATWQLTQMTDMQDQAITMEYNILSLDIDYGQCCLNLYGVLSNQSSRNGQAALGSGYFYANDDGSFEVHMEIRAGTFLYSIKLNSALSGIVAMYDKDGNIFAVGSIDLLSFD